ncbi:MAG TPA: ABC transporter permease [Gammaproteobacteria bacterium]
MMLFRQTIRRLLRTPGFTITVVLMLAVGIGATTAMFSWVHTVLLQPLPVPSPEQLVNLSAPGPKPGSTSCALAGDCPDAIFSYPTFRDLEARQDAFTGIAGHRFFRANLAYDGRTLATAGLLVSGSYFDVLELEPAVGRLIAPADEPRIGESAVVVLSYDHWQNAFGGDPGVVGRTLVVNGASLTIIGVAPRGFSGTTLGAQPKIFVPLSMRWTMEPTVRRDAENRLAYWVYAFARLRPGVTIGEAAAAINVIYRGIIEEIETPLVSFLPPERLEQFKQKQIVITPGAHGQSEIPQNARRPLTLLLGVTGLVLLIVCVNIANLVLARGIARTGELAVHAAIGASRRHLLQRPLAEAAVLAVVGGLASLPVAALILGGIQAMLPGAEARTGFDIELDGAVLAFAAGITLVTALLFGSIPAIKAMRTDPGRVVKGQASLAASGRGMTRFRGSLATSQVALSMLLLALAGLFTQSLMNVARVNLGMDIDSLVTFTVAPRLNGYGTERTMNVFDRLEEALAAAPGVVAVASASVPLIADNDSRVSLTVQGFDAGPGTDTSASTNEVSAGFFGAMSIPLLAGREFGRADGLGAPSVAVVNQAFLRKFGLGMDAVGTRFGEGRGNGVDLDVEIVGIAADAKYSRVKDDVPPQYFLPRRQDDNIGALAFYVRGAVGPETLFATVRGVVNAVDPALPVANLMTMETTVENNVFLDRIVALFSAAFAGLATLLAAVGLYGVLAYNVAQRTRELGVRLALGATPGRLRGLFLRQAGWIALIGMPIGLGAALFVGRALASLLFGLSGSDPGALAAAALVLVCVVAAAGYLPARRAARVVPMEALRYE